MLRVLHIVQRDDPATGGAVRVAAELVKRLAHHEVDAKCVFVYGGPGPFLDEIPDRCLYLGLKSRSDILVHGRRLFWMLQHEVPDIVHHHDGLTWTHLLTCGAFRGARYGHAHLDPPSRNAHWRARIAGWLHRKTYDRLICVSETTRHAWVNRGFSLASTEVIPNGVDTTIFQPPSVQQRVDARRRFHVPVDALVIGYVGRLHNAMKGSDDFVRVLAALPPNIWGIIAGVGPDESVLRALARELGVQSRLSFVGLLNPALPCYQAVDMLVMTSHCEPFGLVVLEAAACEVPVAAFSAQGGVRGLLVAVGATVAFQRNPLELAHLVWDRLGVASCEGTRTELRNIRRVVEENYSWDVAAKAVAQSYHTFQKVLT